MRQARTSRRPGCGEPDSTVALHHLMKDAPITLQQHAQRMARRGEVRRRIEDLLVEKSNVDLW